MNTVQQEAWFNGLLAPPGSAAKPETIKAQQSKAALQALPLPHGKQESWRYTPLDRLYKQTFVPHSSSGSEDIEIDFDDWLLHSDNYRLVLLNGRLAPIEGNAIWRESGITVSCYSRLDDEQRRLADTLLYNSVVFANDRFDYLNQALHNDGLFIEVSDNTVIDKPIEVVHISHAEDQPWLIQPRSIIKLGKSAEATLIEQFVCRGETERFYNAATRVVLADNAQLQHYRLQQEAGQVSHLNRLVVEQSASSRYIGSLITAGSQWSRNDIVAELIGEGAEFELNGLFTVGDRHYRDNHLDIRHRSPHCQSRENFRGLLYGSGRGVFDGRILVERDAQQTDAQLSNKNLMLSDNAEMDTKPQLEIYADNVKCSHGATVGQLDAEQLYYCRSRGFNEQQSRRLLSLAFAEQLLDEISNEAVAQALRQRLRVLLERESGGE